VGPDARISPRVIFCSRMHAHPIEAWAIKATPKAARKLSIPWGSKRRRTTACRGCGKASEWLRRIQPGDWRRSYCSWRARCAAWATGTGFVPLRAIHRSMVSTTAVNAPSRVLRRPDSAVPSIRSTVQLQVPRPTSWMTAYSMSRGCPCRTAAAKEVTSGAS
jgi:hypothetical protein